MPRGKSRADPPAGRLPRTRHALRRGLRPGRGLRRALLAVPHQGRQAPTRCCRAHRTEPLEDLTRATRPHGDGDRHRGPFLPRLHAGVRRQRHLQDGPHPPGRREAQRAAAVQAAGAKVKVLEYAVPSYTGLVHPTRQYYPAWEFPESSPHVQKAIAAYRRTFDGEPEVGLWTFSTNGIATAGIFGIPSLGFGPGHEKFAHPPGEPLSFPARPEASPYRRSIAVTSMVRWRLLVRHPLPPQFRQAAARRRWRNRRAARSGPMLCELDGPAPI